METSKEQILLVGYGLKLLGDTRIRTGRICRTDKGYKELRKLNCDEKRALFMHNAKEHLFKNGFGSISRFVVAMDGLPYYKTEEAIYVLEDYQETDYIDLTDEENLIKSIRLMAKFHNASEGFLAEDGFYNYGKMIEQFEKRNRELNRIKKWIDRQSSKSSVDLIVMSHMNYYKDRAEVSKHMTNKDVYNKLISNDKNKKCFCHNNFKSETIMVKDGGDLLLTGFEKCAYDCTVVDLAEFFRRYLKEPYAKIDMIYKMLEEYSKIRSISEYELQVLKGMIVFPKKFFKLCNQYYNKRRVFVSDAMLEKFQNCIEETKKNKDLLNTLVLK